MTELEIYMDLRIWYTYDLKLKRGILADNFLEYQVYCEKPVIASKIAR